MNGNDLESTFQGLYRIALRYHLNRHPWDLEQCEADDLHPHDSKRLHISRRKLQALSGLIDDNKAVQALWQEYAPRRVA